METDKMNYEVVFYECCFTCDLAMRLEDSIWCEGEPVHVLGLCDNYEKGTLDAEI